MSAFGEEDETLLPLLGIEKMFLRNPTVILPSF
jgi:hypothetical protein